MKRALNTLVVGLCLIALAGCGNRSAGPKSLAPNGQLSDAGPRGAGDPSGTTIWDLFKKKDTGTNVSVNRYLWNASLEVLNFLPIQSVDPFTGVIVTGYGTPPGGGRSYRATIYIKDAALDARSLNVALQSRGGSVGAGTQRAVEDAILSRARQLRIKDRKF